MKTIKKHKVLFLCLAVLLVAGGITGGVLAYQAATAPPLEEPQPDWVEAPERSCVEGLSMEFESMNVSAEENKAEIVIKITNRKESPVHHARNWEIDYLLNDKWYTVYRTYQGSQMSLGEPFWGENTSGRLSLEFPFDKVKKAGVYRIVNADGTDCSSFCEMDVLSDLE